jgi:A/G-specific adenine glycosylase
MEQGSQVNLALHERAELLEAGKGDQARELQVGVPAAEGLIQDGHRRSIAPADTLIAVVDAQALRRWYRPRREAYPWRSTSDPYRVLVSEVMLQQTQAARVAPVFERFIQAYPTVEALAAAPVADVLRAWSGLGYNRRAVALARSAGIIVRDHGGHLPTEPGTLRGLPGVGPYTAAAVASISHGAVVPAVDTNVRRVVARAALGRDPGTVHPSAVADDAARRIDRADPGGWNQAVMDLGREVCRPVPRCERCPIARDCRWRARPANRHQADPSSRPGPPPFEGSTRQLRGRIVRHLGPRGWASLAALSAVSGQPVTQVAAAVRTLVADGLVRAGPTALLGAPGGRVRLAD